MVLFATFASGQVTGQKTIGNAYSEGSTLQNKGLFESFESWPPAGWTFADYGQSGGWFQAPQVTFPAGGRHVASTFGVWFFDEQDQWLISPEVTVSRGDTLSFWASAHMGYDDDHLDIMVSQGGTGAPSFTDCIGHYDFTSGNKYPWKKIKLDLSPYEGKTILLAWREKTGIPGAMLMIDMVRVGPVHLTDACMAKIDFPRYIPPGETSISGILFNEGLHVINQAEVNWQVDNGPVKSEMFSGMSMAEGQSFYFTCKDKYIASQGLHNLKVWISKVNALEPDENPTNDVLRISFKTSPGIVPKIHLQEAFTASWCGGCPAYNRNVIDPVSQTYKGRIATIKYQEDKYYIPEDKARCEFYSCPGWAPQLYIDGYYPPLLIDDLSPAVNLEYIDHKITSIDDKWAGADIQSKHSINKTTKSIELNAVITPYFSGSVYKTYISVVEKATTGNAASSHENECHSVLMKMIPDAQGLAMDFVDGVPNTIHQTADLKNTFIEEFSDLEVVVFVQNTTTKEVIQAAYSEETGSISDAEYVNQPKKEVNVYPNPSKDLFNISGACESDLQICDASGKELFNVKNAKCFETVDLTRFKRGIYLLKVTRGKDFSLHKLLLE